MKSSHPPSRLPLAVFMLAYSLWMLLAAVYLHVVWSGERFAICALVSVCVWVTAAALSSLARHTVKRKRRLTIYAGILVMSLAWVLFMYEEFDALR